MEKIKGFVERVEKATKSGSREIRLNLSEAQQICFELTTLLLKEQKLFEKIIVLQNLIDSPEIPSGQMDGGKF